LNIEDDEDDLYGEEDNNDYQEEVDEDLNDYVNPLDVDDPFFKDQPEA
jgi:hypothetical protein